MAHVYVLHRDIDCKRYAHVNVSVVKRGNVSFLVGNRCSKLREVLSWRRGSPFSDSAESVFFIAEMTEVLFFEMRKSFQNAEKVIVFL